MTEPPPLEPPGLPRYIGAAPTTEYAEEEPTIGYAYADQRLESLTPAQKQLLRTGPRNVRIIQTSLRQIALALGIPPERLPATAP